MTKSGVENRAQASVDKLAVAMQMVIESVITLQISQARPAPLPAKRAFSISNRERTKERARGSLPCGMFSGNHHSRA